MKAAGPISRILSALRRDGHSSGPRITARLKRPTRRLWRAEPARVPGETEASPETPSLFGLAPCGVCPARRITAPAVRSYRTFSPLPEPCGPRRYVFCGTFRRTIPPIKARGPSRTLSGTLLCGVRTFLCLATATVRSGCQQNHYSGDAASCVSTRKLRDTFTGKIPCRFAGNSAGR